MKTLAENPGESSADVDAAEVDASVAAQMWRLARSFLVHSFLYEQLGEPLIDDVLFDRLGKTLLELRDAHPQVELPYADCLQQALSGEQSAFRIRRYPAELVTVAFKLLYLERQQGEEFAEFVEQRGYRVSLPDEGTEGSA